MPADSTATKERILEAAFREFASHGLAGARVDRIAEKARANKRAIYVYFGNKEALFDIVLVKKLTTATATVPDQWDDLPEYAGALFDYFAADPDRPRLNAWRQLERPAAVEDEIAVFRSKLQLLRDAQSPREILDAADVFAIIFAIHHAWILAPNALWQASGETDPSAERQARHRRAVVESVRRMTTPPAMAPR